MRHAIMVCSTGSNSAMCKKCARYPKLSKTVQSAHECDMIMRCKTSKFTEDAKHAWPAVMLGTVLPSNARPAHIFVQLVLDAVSSEQISLSALHAGY